MRLAIGADHAGFEVKEKVKSFLAKEGHEVIDVGTNSAESVDYPDFAEKVASSVKNKKADFGVLFCGTGIGMSMAANKIRGVRAAVCHNEHAAEMSRKHNDANVFCAGARVLSYDVIEKLLKLWLATPFEGGRHERRVSKISNLDSK